MYIFMIANLLRLSASRRGQANCLRCHLQHCRGNKNIIHDLSVSLSFHVWFQVPESEPFQTCSVYFFTSCAICRCQGAELFQSHSPPTIKRKQCAGWMGSNAMLETMRINSKRFAHCFLWHGAELQYVHKFEGPRPCACAGAF